MYLFPMNGFGVAYALSTDCRYTVGAPAGYVPSAYILSGAVTEAGYDFQYMYNNGAATAVNTAAPLILSSASGTITACPISTPCTASGQYIGVRFFSDISVTTTTPPVVVVQLAIVAAGSYRTLTGFITACPAGYYGATAGLTTSTCTGLCPCGTYGATTGLTSSTCTGQCAAGRYGLAASVRTGASCDGACTAGYYCTAGSCSATQNACPPGTYGGTTGLTTAACTGPCSIGYYGASGGLTVNTCTGPCAAGYYGSATGQTSSTCSGLCACGTWGNAGMTSTTCTGQCAAGRFGLAASVRTGASCDGACTPGFYCPAGSCTAAAVQCPAGSFCPAGAGAPTACGCPALCPAGSSANAATCSATATSTATTTASGSAMRTASSAPTASATTTRTATASAAASPTAPATGTRTAASTGSATASATASLCPAPPGFYCVGGAPTLCPVGSFCAGGARTPCAPATACAVVGLVVQPPCYWNTSTLAGSGAAAFADGAGTGASFRLPRGLSISSGGNLIIADQINNRIRYVTLAGIASTAAGGGAMGSADGIGTTATFNNPQVLQPTLVTIRLSLAMVSIASARWRPVVL